MKKRFFSIAVIPAIFFVSSVNFVQAQIPEVPAPVNADNICFEKEGEKLLPVPCDKYKNKRVPAFAQTSEERQKFEKNASRLFSFLSEKINKIINDLEGGFQNIFDGIREYFASIR